MRIFLLGMMGSGKSTLGGQLAQRLKIPFEDLDHYLETREGKSIPEIFATNGEAYFREKETFYLKELCKRKQLVVATGGGAPCFNDNIHVMNAAGITIFLDVSHSELANRLYALNGKDMRPLIAGKTQEELLVFLYDLYEKRRPFYEEAKIVIPGDATTTDHIIETLNDLED